uniref:Phospholipase A2 n=1 Tax=Panagrolaimus sp. ES5 TaxID=591445 RepID=A0AC34FUR2_9BILA
MDEDEADHFYYKRINSDKLSDLLRYHCTAGDLQHVMKLLAYDCDVNGCDLNGNTPLHIAVLNEFLGITRILLAFEANPNILNNNGETPRHIAARLEDRAFIEALIIGGADRCSISAVGCKSGCINEIRLNTSSVEINDKAQYPENRAREISLQDTQDKIYVELLNALKESVENNSKNFLNILSLDGGGIRGLVILQLLNEIEKMVGEPLFQYFDWVAGTSTGAIIAAALAKGKSIRDCQKLYLRFKDSVFKGSRRPEHCSNALVNFLQQEMGEKTLLSDIPWPRVMISSVKIDEPSGYRTIWMRNYQSSPSKIGDNLLLVKALQRSSAAPTYFKAVDEVYIDGGLSANNPILDLLTEINKWNLNPANETVRIGSVISIGTGIDPNDQPLQSLDFSRNPITSVKSYCNLAKFGIDQATASEGKLTEHAMVQCSASRIPMFRLNPPFSKNFPLDTTDDSELAKMMWECFVYIRKNHEYIKKIAVLLKKIEPSFNRKHLFKNVPQQLVSILSISEYISLLKLNDPDIKLLTLKKLHRSLSNIPASLAKQNCKVISTNESTNEMKKILTECLKIQNASIQFEAASIINIINIKTNQIIQDNTVPLFFHLLSSDDASICEQAIMALGMSFHSLPICKVCVQLGIIQLLAKMAHTQTSYLFTNYATFILHIISLYMRKLLPHKLVQKLDETLLKLTMLSDVPTVALIIDRVINHSRLFDNVARDVGYIQSVYKLLYEIIANKICDIDQNLSIFNFLSDIATDCEIQIQAMIDAKFIPLLLDSLVNNANAEIKHKAHDILSKIISLGSQAQVLIVVAEFFRLFCSHIEYNENETSVETLCQLNAILEKNDVNQNEINNILGQCYAIEKIKSFKNVKINETAEFSSELITAYYLK